MTDERKPLDKRDRRALRRLAAGKSTMESLPGHRREKLREHLLQQATMCAHGNDPAACEVCHPELESDEDYEARQPPENDYMGYDTLEEREIDRMDP